MNVIIEWKKLIDVIPEKFVLEVIKTFPNSKIQSEQMWAFWSLLYLSFTLFERNTWNNTKSAISWIYFLFILITYL